MRSASADLRTFADDKSSTGALRVIGRHYVSRNVTRAGTRHRWHYNTVY
ncbi:hypothetical protein AB46_4433 [Escherichia coli 3-267-03_S1_C2]|nr:hypothetical protein AB46_4433 [Escherichia coli 3-267-03_S1_C2]